MYDDLVLAIASQITAEHRERGAVMARDFLQWRADLLVDAEYERRLAEEEAEFQRELAAERAAYWADDFDY